MDSSTDAQHPKFQMSPWWLGAWNRLIYSVQRAEIYQHAAYIFALAVPRENKRSQFNQSRVIPGNRNCVMYSKYKKLE